MPDSIAIQVLYEYCNNHLADLVEGEIGSAFGKFAAKELDYQPEFTGLISAILLTDIIKSYRRWWKKNVLEVTYQFPWQKPLTAIGDTNLEQLNKQAAIDAFERFKTNPNAVFPSCHYDTLDALDLMDFTPAEKREMMAEAEAAEKLHLAASVDKTQSWVDKQSLKAQLDNLMPKDCVSRAKSIALVGFFRNLVINEVELSDLIANA